MGAWLRGATCCAALVVAALRLYCSQFDPN
jgi:hypothetical protein